MAIKHFPKGLDGRQRDKDRQIRQKRSDTKVATLRKEYRESIASGYRPDATLGTVLKQKGLDSLDQLLKKKTMMKAVANDCSGDSSACYRDTL